MDKKKSDETERNREIDTETKLTIESIRNAVNQSRKFYWFLLLRLFGLVIWIDLIGIIWRLCYCFDLLGIGG